MSVLETFPARIAELRKSLGMTQREFAKELDITAATISAYENGAKFPSIVTVYEIAQRFGVSIDWLCGNKVKRHSDAILSSFISFINLMETPDFKGKNIGVEQTHNAIIIGCSPGIKKAIEEYSKMLELYNSGTIDENLYTLWLNDKIKKIKDIAEKKR